MQEGSTTTTESLCYQFFQFLSVLTEKEAPSKKIDDSYYMYRKLPGKRSSLLETVDLIPENTNNVVAQLLLLQRSQY